MIRLVLPGFALLLAAAAFAMTCGPATIVLLHKNWPVPSALLLARAWPICALSLAALPLGALGAAGLASVPHAPRRFACGLLALAVLGMGLPSPHPTLTSLLASVAIVMLILTPRLASLDPVLLDAASASGASPWDRFVLIVLPRIAGPCLGAFLLCLAANAGFWLFAG